MCSYSAVISALPWTMVFCNTKLIRCRKIFYGLTDDNRARPLVTIAVQRGAVDTSIAFVKEIY